jgi:hypothetical protein
VRALRLVGEMEFQSVWLVVSSDGDKRVENGFKVRRGTRPDAGKRLAMHRQFAHQPANGVRSKIEVAEARVAADR